jgi:hypothetical protein
MTRFKVDDIIVSRKNRKIIRKVIDIRNGYYRVILVGENHKTFSLASVISITIEHIDMHYVISLPDLLKKL